MEIRNRPPLRKTSRLIGFACILYLSYRSYRSLLITRAAHGNEGAPAGGLRLRERFVIGSIDHPRGSTFLSASGFDLSLFHFCCVRPVEVPAIYLFSTVFGTCGASFRIESLNEIGKICEPNRLIIYCFVVILDNLDVRMCNLVVRMFLRKN